MPITITIDTNLINAKEKDPVLNKIEQFMQERKIKIFKTDAMDTEMQDGNYVSGLVKSSKFSEDIGTGVWDHSRGDHALWGVADDDILFGQILEVLFGKKDRQRYIKNEIKDAMHLQKDKNPQQVRLHQYQLRAVSKSLPLQQNATYFLCLFLLLETQFQTSLLLQKALKLLYLGFGYLCLV